MCAFKTTIVCAVMLALGWLTFTIQCVHASSALKYKYIIFGCICALTCVYVGLT